MSLSFSVRKMMLCWGLAAAASSAAFGQTFSLEGGEYVIAGSLPGDQTFPQAAINSNGGYLVWQDNAVSTSGLRIRAARLDSDLTLSGSNLVVSSKAKTASIGNQQKPQVALLQNGGAAIVWQEGKPAYQQIYARFAGATGSLIGKDIRVSPRPKYSQHDACVATLADGTVVIVWSSAGQDGSMQGIFARLYSPAGKPLGNEFQVNQFAFYNQRSPDVAALANGQFVVVWVSELQRNMSSVDVYARVFDVSGAPVANEFPVDTSTNHFCANPAVAGSSQGGFAVVWSLNDNVSRPMFATSFGAHVDAASLNALSRSTNGWDICGRVFDASYATTNSVQFRVNSYTYGDQFAPRISALGAQYMVVWTSLAQDGSREGVFGQFITGSGDLASSADLQVNTTWISRQIQPSVVSDGTGRFLVTWSSFVGGAASFDLFAQQYLQSAP